MVALVSIAFIHLKSYFGIVERVKFSKELRIFRNINLFIASYSKQKYILQLLWTEYCCAGSVKSIKRRDELLRGG